MSTARRPTPVAFSVSVGGKNKTKAFSSRAKLGHFLLRQRMMMQLTKEFLKDDRFGDFLTGCENLVQLISAPDTFV